MLGWESKSAGDVNVIPFFPLVSDTSLFAIQITSVGTDNRPFFLAEAKICGTSVLSVTEIKVLGLFTESHTINSLMLPCQTVRSFPFDNTLNKTGGLCGLAR